MSDLVVAIVQDGFSHEATFLGLAGMLKIADIYSDLGFAFNLAEYNEYFGESSSTDDFVKPTPSAYGAYSGIPLEVEVDESTATTHLSYNVDNFLICVLVFAVIGILFDLVRLIHFIQHVRKRWKELGTTSWLGKTLTFWEKMESLRNDKDNRYELVWWTRLNLILEEIPQVAVALIFVVKAGCDQGCFRLLERNNDDDVCTDEQAKFARSLVISAYFSLCTAIVICVIEIVRFHASRKKQIEEQKAKENSWLPTWIMPNTWSSSFQ